MKKIYLLGMAVFGLQSFSIAQTPCDAGRYSTELFPNVTVSTGINFGQSTDFIGNNTVLDLDIYEPTGDTETARPLIIWAHGGSFIGGSRTDSDVVTLATAFAKKGLVCASIDYRVGMWPIDSVNAVKAVVRSVQDMKAAVRFFYKDRATANTYKVDTNNIIIAGSSAGAITALQYAYLDKNCEAEYYIPAADLTALGGIEGTSGNPGYSSDVHAAVSLAGALASYGWLEAGDIPFCSMHGNVDDVVPYNRGAASVSGFNVITMDGSRMLYEQANAVGVQNNFYSYFGAGHIPFLTSAAYMDTTINFVADFLVDFLGCTEPIVLTANTPNESANLYQLSYCGLGLNSINNEFIDRIYPNPSNNEITVEFNRNTSIQRIELLDLYGRLLNTYDSTTPQLILRKDKLGAGTYILRITNENGISSTKKVIFN